MLIETYLIVLLLIGHFLGDFMYQSRAVAKNKSNLREPYWLFWHATVIWCWTAGPLVAFTTMPIGMILLVSLFIAAVHGIIDACSWNLYKLTVRKRFPNLKAGEEFKYWEDHWFYTTIGADQLSHVLTIIFAINVFPLAYVLGG